MTFCIYLYPALPCCVNAFILITMIIILLSYAFVLTIEVSQLNSTLVMLPWQTLSAELLHGLDSKLPGEHPTLHAVNENNTRLNTFYGFEKDQKWWLDDMQTALDNLSYAIGGKILMKIAKKFHSMHNTKDSYVYIISASAAVTHYSTWCQYIKLSVQLIPN
jgi:hypothetical protein